MISLIRKLQLAVHPRQEAFEANRRRPLNKRKEDHPPPRPQRSIIERNRLIRRPALSLRSRHHLRFTMKLHQA